MIRLRRLSADRIARLDARVRPRAFFKSSAKSVSCRAVRVTSPVSRTGSSAVSKTARSVSSAARSDNRAGDFPKEGRPGFSGKRGEGRSRFGGGGAGALDIAGGGGEKLRRQSLARGRIDRAKRFSGSDGALSGDKGNSGDLIHVVVAFKIPGLRDPETSGCGSPSNSTTSSCSLPSGRAWRTRMKFSPTTGEYFSPEMIFGRASRRVKMAPTGRVLFMAAPESFTCTMNRNRPEPTCSKRVE